MYELGEAIRWDEAGSTDDVYSSLLVKSISENTLFIIHDSSNVASITDETNANYIIAVNRHVLHPTTHIYPPSPALPPAFPSRSIPLPAAFSASPPLVMHSFRGLGGSETIGGDLRGLVIHSLRDLGGGGTIRCDSRGPVILSLRKAKYGHLRIDS